MSLNNRFGLWITCSTGALVVASCQTAEGDGLGMAQDGEISSAYDANAIFPADARQDCVVSDSEWEGWTTLDVPIDLVADLTEKFQPWIEIDQLKVPKVYDKDSGLIYVFPADGPDFPGDIGSASSEQPSDQPQKRPDPSDQPDFRNATDCDFFKWSSRMFLWATSTISDAESQPVPTQYPGPDTPYVFASEFFYGVQDNPSYSKNAASGSANSYRFVLQQQGNGGIGTTKLREGKGDEIAGTGQAGNPSGVLFSNQSGTMTNLVHYAKHVNRTFGYFLAENGTGTQKPFPISRKDTCDTAKYGLQNGYAENTVISEVLYMTLCRTNPATLANLTDGKQSGEIPQLETAIDFFSMSMELKTSWVEVDPSWSQAKRERYITMTGQVPTVTPTSATSWKVDETTLRQTTLAMVGMHVVGTVQGHPEMVWATFEHVDNAPNQPYVYFNSAGNKVVNDDFDLVGRDWLFSSGKKSAKSSTESQCDIGTAKPPYVYNDGNITLSTGSTADDLNINRMNPWGSPSACFTGLGQWDLAPYADKNTQLISLNRSVIGHVASEQPNDPRQYYFLSGSIWTSDSAVPYYDGNTLIASLTGTVHPANTTMETFNQGLSCFTCHAMGAKGGQPTGVSHIYNSINPRTVPKFSK